MGASPDYKVYNAQGKYRAACVDAAEAAALASFLGDGATIRWGHSSKWRLWTEGHEDHPAGESYDYVAQVAAIRLESLQRASLAKAREGQP